MCGTHGFSFHLKIKRIHNEYLHWSLLQKNPGISNLVVLLIKNNSKNFTASFYPLRTLFLEAQILFNLIDVSDLLTTSRLALTIISPSFVDRFGRSLRFCNQKLLC